MQILDHILVDAKWCPSPNRNARPTGEVSLLVVHNISLPPNQFGGHYIEDFFCNQLDCTAHDYFAEIHTLQVSAHLLIRRDGGLVQFVPFNQRAWHAGVSNFEGRENCNDFSIGIELEGADHIPYEPCQYTQLAQVTQLLMQTYSAITPARIVGHNQIAPQRKTDPGESFDWSTYQTLLGNV